MAKRLERSHHRWQAASLFVVGLSLAAALSACGRDSDRTVVTVYAASSLTDIISQVEQSYELQHPDIDIRVNLAGTNTLLRQLNSGAQADLFIAADVSAFDQMLDDVAGGPFVLATNTLTMVVPTENPGGINTAADVAQSNVLTARCATGVPCGDATDQYLQAAGFGIGRSTDEANVRSVLAKVSSGEVDAGFVYRSDATTGAGIKEIPLRDPPRVTIAVAVLSNETSAGLLADVLQSEPAAAKFVDLGFELPKDGAAGAIVSDDQ